MIEVLTYLGEYVPTISTEDTVSIHGEEPVKVTEDSFHTIALGKCFIYIIIYIIMHFCTCIHSLCVNSVQYVLKSIHYLLYNFFYYMLYINHI